MKQIDRLKKIIKIAEKYPFKNGDDFDINFGVAKREELIWIGVKAEDVSEKDIALLQKLGAEINEHYSTIEFYC